MYPKNISNNIANYLDITKKKKLMIILISFYCFFRPIYWNKDSETHPIFQLKENLKNGRLLNHGFPIIKQEINEIMNFYRNGSSIKDIEQFFQRSEITIKKLLKKHLNLN